MFKRKILKNLSNWAENPNRKPLVLRGARQVGKTTVVNLFSEEFEEFISLNLEDPKEKALFDVKDTFENILESVYFKKKKKQEGRKTLIFIDEIQNSSSAVALLRYFYEKRPDLFVIAAGSLLETALDASASFPVGRVQFLILHPLSFEEYLLAMEEEQVLEMYHQVPVLNFAHEELLLHFHRYTLIGGMPEIVQIYKQNKDLMVLNEVYDSLIIAYLEDVEKYAERKSQVPIIRHVIQSAMVRAGSRIKYGGFGDSNYKAKDVREALAILEKAFLFQVVHPTTSCELTLTPNVKRSPRLHLLDTGLVNYFAGMQEALFESKEISAVYSGRIAEHIVGQELFAMDHSPLSRLNFWVREKSQSNAEVDYLVQKGSRLIPLEVKSGATGRLRSLHQFMDCSSQDIGIRVYGGKFSVEEGVTLRGKKFGLLNIPYYHTAKFSEYIENNFKK